MPICTRWQGLRASRTDQSSREPGAELPRLLLAAHGRQGEIAVVQQNDRHVRLEAIQARFGVEYFLLVVSIDAFVDFQIQAATKTGGLQDRRTTATWWNWPGMRVSPCGAVAKRRGNDAIEQLLALDEESIRREQLQGQPQVGDRLGKAALADQQSCAVQEYVGVGDGTSLQRGLEPVNGPRRLAAVGKNSARTNRDKALSCFSSVCIASARAAASFNRDVSCRAMASPTPTESDGWRRTMLSATEPRSAVGASANRRSTSSFSAACCFMGCGSCGFRRRRAVLRRFVSRRLRPR